MKNLFLMCVGLLLAVSLQAEDAQKSIDKAKKFNAKQEFAKGLELAKKAETEGNNLQKAYALLIQGDSYIGLKKYPEGVAACKKILELENLGPHLKNGAYCKLGDLYTRQQKFSEAEESYLKAKEVLKDKNIMADFGLGMVYFNQKKYDQALKQLQIVAASPEANKYQKAGAVIQQGRIYIELKQPDKAKAKFKEVINSKYAAPGHKQYARDLLKGIKE